MFNRREQRYLKVLKRLPVWLSVAIAIIIYVGLRYFYFRPAYVAGEKIPTLSGTLANGNRFDLATLDGKYVLIDFWGSWCGPCIADMPEIDKLYARYHEAGLEIVSVAIERDEQRWRAALKYFSPASPYQLFDHVSNFKFFNGKLTHEFGVRRLPTTFLVGPDGVVIGTNLGWGKIDDFLATRLDTPGQH